ncbi:MAG: MCP four helix bundle domain-containing protein [Nitrospirae bacterium]|uniref:MCP four helix bundle domain-containing protein n=1 Tax=Candidatus Magnetobacterium casense TaxID=1455061 RepID=UPI00058BCE22|nr:MCP four helix bundle domain-containing protein [Candidatus Magnetobacterium casensis]MBF0339059.1 MCP four helix bundle domain-containing protein [Nitrospirota bacterium]
MKIGTRLGAGFLLILLLLMAVAVFGINRMHNLYGLVYKMHRHPFTVIRTVSRIDANVIRIDQYMNYIVRAKDLSDVDKDSLYIDEAEKEVLENFNTISVRFLGDKAMYDTALGLYLQWKPLRGEIISLVKAGKLDEAEAILHGRHTDHISDINKATSVIVSFAQNKAETFLQDAENTTKDALDLMWIFLPLAADIL